VSERFATIAPTEADAQLASESSRKLATHKLGRRASVRIQVLDEYEPETIALPASALRLLQHITPARKILPHQPDAQARESSLSRKFPRLRVGLV
jgi:hypothetical protein